MKHGWMGVVAGCAMLGGCSGGGSHVSRVGDDAPVAADWRGVATPADRTRLRGWRDAWVKALAQVAPADAATQPALFDPDRTLSDPLPPAGSYRCRTFKLGASTAPVSGPGQRFAGYGWFACRVDTVGGRLTFVKTSGSQRPAGTIYADTDARGVFLGTVVLGDERMPIGYGRDAKRDMAGLVERIGARRWRLVLPYPQFESTLDVIEMVPG